MAQRRMFSIAVIDTDKFNDMPISARLLYYELGMRADDDGFVDSPKKIIKMVGCSEDDLKSLIVKGFVICFDSGVIVITHWKMHNYIQADRYKKSIYQEERSKLKLENNIYSLSDLSAVDTECIQDVSEMDTQDRLGKDRLSKVRLDNNMSTSVDGRNAFDYQSVINSFNSICISLPKVQKLTDTRKKKIKNTSKLLGELTFEDVFCKVESSDFLSGRNGKWTACCFDWILNPTNLTKIIEGNYANKQNATANTQRNYEGDFWDE